MLSSPIVSAGLALAIAIGAGCATGRFPTATSRRPLTMPGGEHELAVGAGSRIFESGLGFRVGEVPAQFLAHYRYGITDRLEYLSPLLATYRFGDDGASQLAITGGLSGVGWGSYRLRSYDGDPRTPNATVEGLLTTPGVFATYGAPASELVAWRLRAGAHGLFFRTRAVEVIGHAHGAVLIDFGAHVSVAIGVGVDWSHDVDRDVGSSRFVLGGVGDGSAPVGAPAAVVFHWSEQVDLFFGPYMTFEFGDYRVRAGGVGGGSWHWE